MLLLLLQNIWILPQSRQVKSFIRPHFHLILYFAKDDTSTSYEQVDKLNREFNIHYRACIGSLSYLLSIRVDLTFSVHKLEKFSENPGKYTMKDWYIY